MELTLSISLCLSVCVCVCLSLSFSLLDKGFGNLVFYAALVCIRFHLVTLNEISFLSIVYVFCWLRF